MPPPIARPVELTTFEAALAHNLAVVHQRAPAASVWAVAKARGYGHGVAAATRGFTRAEGLAVLEIQEAVEARELGWQKPILLLEGAFGPADLEACAALNLDLVVHHQDQMEWLLSRLDEFGRSRGRVWIKLNTGMNRLGFAPDAHPSLASGLRQLRRERGPERLGWLTHLARAESPPATERPLARLQEALHTLEAQAGEAVSICNSAGVFTLPHAHRDWVRPGLALYGASPLEDPMAEGQTAEALGLQPAGALRSRVIALQTLGPGDTVGYGERYRAERPMRIGVVAGGYADGLPRSAPDGTPVWVAGRTCDLVGRVSMDMVTVDLTDHPGAGIGSEVEFWGPRLSIDRVAAACGTIAYELMTGVTERVARRVVSAPSVQEGVERDG